jgi:hypothetical protein
MRKDYQYILGAVSLTLTATEKGDNIINHIIEHDVSPPHGGVIEVLMFVQEVYVSIDGTEATSATTLRTWYDRLLRSHEEYCGPTGLADQLSVEQFGGMFADDLLSIKLTIWDEPRDGSARN